ncbi:glycosyltransferase family 39 protein [bacterium]|nr:glycosyltransferase family 39 protein [bacterium]
MKIRYRPFIISALLVFTLGGAALRLIHIGRPSIWVDEANTVFSAESVIETGLPLMPTGYVYGRAPLYTYSVTFIYQILGASLENARIISAIFGVLCIPLVYVIATLFFGWRVGLISAFFTAFGFYEIGWSRVARMYTQFQFFTLLSLLFFLLGFERQIFPKTSLNKRSWNLFDFPFLEGVDIVALLLFGLMTVITYFGIHRLAALNLSGLVAYILIRTSEKALSKSDRHRWLNKYSLISMFILITGALMFLIMPAFIQSLIQFMDYTPAWAKTGSSVIDPLVLIKFLFSRYRFPLGLLFVWGSIQVILRRNRPGWMPLLLILIPLFSLSFIFTHRHPKYLFGVYPFFFMLAAYGLICLMEVKSVTFFRRFHISKKSIQRIIAILIGAAFIISPWLRIAKNIPWQEDGKSNGAVYFNEWKEAAHILHQQMKPNDLVICSLPEALLYYDIGTDWALNGNNLALSSERMIVDKQGRFIDVYAGRPLIDSLDLLTDLVNTRVRGWILFTVYHYNRPDIVPPDIRNYLETHFHSPRWTKNHTVVIYSWDYLSETEHAF